MTGFLPPEFPWGHPQTPPYYFCSPLFHSLLLSSISAPSQSQSSLGSLPSPRGTSQLLSTSLQVLGVPF